MVTIADLVGLVIVVGINAAIAAVCTRLLRVRLATTWGTALYVLVFVPVIEVAVTLVLTGPLGLGPDLGSAVAVVGVAVALPFALGVAFDLFWMPAPEEVDLPERSRNV